MKEEKLFKSIGYIDDLLIERSEAVVKKRRTRGALKITAIAAAAALTVLMGAAVVEFSRAEIGNERINFNVTVQNEIYIPTAEELAEIGAVYSDDNPYAGQGSAIYSDTVSPLEVISLFDIPVLMNGEYFTEKNGMHMQYAVDRNLSFYYTLIDNETGAELDFTLDCALAKDYAQIVTYTGGSAYWDYKLLTLQDGSNAVVAQGIVDGVSLSDDPPYSTANFCHEGRLYSIHSWGIGKDGMISVLEKLGVL